MCATRKVTSPIKCKVKNGGGAKKEKKQTSKLSNTYTNKVDKKAFTPYLLKKKKNEKLKEKLASSQDAYKSLLAKIETMCKHCDELTNKVANLEVVGTTPTEALKKKNSIFDRPKKDASTSCNDLCLDSPLCNQVYVEKVVVDTCTQEVAKENKQLK